MNNCPQLLQGDLGQGQDENSFPLSASGSHQEVLKDQGVMGEEAPGDIHTPQFCLKPTLLSSAALRQLF